MPYQPVSRLRLDAAARAEFDVTLEMLQKTLASFHSLPKEVRMGSQKLGERSDFCRYVATSLVHYPELAPPGIDMQKMNDDLDLHDFLKPRIALMQQLVARAEDALVAIGIDLMHSANAGYRMIRTFGQGSDMEELRKDLAHRLRTRSRSKPAPEEKKPAPEEKKSVA